MEAETHFNIESFNIGSVILAHQGFIKFSGLGTLNNPASGTRRAQDTGPPLDPSITIKTKGPGTIIFGKEV